MSTEYEPFNVVAATAGPHSGGLSPLLPRATRLPAGAGLSGHPEGRQGPGESNLCRC